MLSEPLTLYKLMTLYMLKQVKFPLSGSQLSEFLITAETIRNSSRYQITREGEETLSFFGKEISAAIVQDMDEFLKANKVRLRDEIGVTAEYYKSTNQDYVVHCEVREGRSILIELNLAVPDREQAEDMCNRWSQSNQGIYSFVMKELMRQD